MNHISEHTIQTNKATLEQQQQQLVQHIKSALASQNLSLEQFADIQTDTLALDEYLDLIEQYFSHILTHEIANLKANITALSQIEIGLYGMCPYCENPISESVLIANPAKQKCISCETQNNDQY